MSTPYAITPVGANGLEHERTQVVLGKDLADSLTRQELARRVATLVVEVDRLRRQVARNGGDDLERALERLDAQCQLRVRDARRLDRVAAAFGAIVRQFPQTASIIDDARADIWDLR